MNKLIIFGTGQVSDIISHYFKNDSNVKVYGYCEDKKYVKKSKFNNLPVFTTEEVLKKYKPNDYYIHVAISYIDMNSLRKKKFEFFKKKNIDY